MGAPTTIAQWRAASRLARAAPSGPYAKSANELQTEGNGILWIVWGFGLAAHFGLTDPDASILQIPLYLLLGAFASLVPMGLVIFAEALQEMAFDFLARPVALAAEWLPIGLLCFGGGWLAGFPEGGYPAAAVAALLSVRALVGEFQSAPEPPAPAHPEIEADVAAALDAIPPSIEALLDPIFAGYASSEGPDRERRRRDLLALVQTSRDLSEAEARLASRPEDVALRVEVRGARETLEAFVSAAKS